jgi:hypothetical protein
MSLLLFSPLLTLRQKELAETGHPRAAHSLGAYHLEGKVVDKDVNEAIRWFTIGARGGLFVSTVNLGKIYFERSQAGTGVPTDLKRAEEWFSIALAQSPNDATCLESLEETRRLLALGEGSESKGEEKDKDREQGRGS